MELSFTARGVVAAPDTLQVRVRSKLQGPVRSGHPEPSRAMTPEEVLAALEQFTVRRVGPRARPVQRWVLSGLDPGDLGHVAAWVEVARGWGIERVTLHLPWGSRPVETGADAVVLPIRRADDATAVPGWGCEVTALVRLDPLTDVLAAVSAAARAGAHRLIAAWPFPPDAAIAPVVEAPAWLDAVAVAAASTPWSVQGLPPCLLGRHGARTHRARNRYYVDADHPPARAHLFFPDVTAWHKGESCRFCMHDAACDGLPASWIGPDAPVLRPMRNTSSP